MPRSREGNWIDCKFERTWNEHLFRITQENKPNRKTNQRNALTRQRLITCQLCCRHEAMTLLLGCRSGSSRNSPRRTYVPVPQVAHQTDCGRPLRRARKCTRCSRLAPRTLGPRRRNRALRTALTLRACQRSPRRNICGRPEPRCMWPHRRTSSRRRTPLA